MNDLLIVLGLTIAGFTLTYLIVLVSLIVIIPLVYILYNNFGLFVSLYLDVVGPEDNIKDAIAVQFFHIIFSNAITIMGVITSANLLLLYKGGH